MGMEHVSMSLIFLTRFEEAEEKAQEALAVSREIGDRQHEARALLALSMCHLCRGDFTGAHQLAEESLKIGEKIRDVYSLVYDNWLLAEMAWARILRTGVSLRAKVSRCWFACRGIYALHVGPTPGCSGLHLSGDEPQIHRRYRRVPPAHALSLLESPMTAMGGGTVWANLGWCALSLGDLEIAAESFEKGLQIPSMFMLVERPRYLSGSALLASRQDRHDEALALADEACDYAVERSMCHLLFPVSICSGTGARRARGV